MEYEWRARGIRQQGMHRVTSGAGRSHTKPSPFRQDGVTSIEYALLASLIAMAIVIGVGTLGGQVKAMYEYVAEKVIEVVGT